MSGVGGHRCCGFERVIVGIGVCVRHIAVDWRNLSRVLGAQTFAKSQRRALRNGAIATFESRKRRIYSRRPHQLVESEGRHFLRHILTPIRAGPRPRSVFYLLTRHHSWLAGIDLVLRFDRSITPAHQVVAPRLYYAVA